MGKLLVNKTRRLPDIKNILTEDFLRFSAWFIAKKID